MFLFDSIGLGLFTIIGVEIGLAAGLHPVICILLGTLSASFGGVIRDILSNEVPLIFHKEVYASLSILGGITYLLLQETALPSNWAYVLTSSMVVILRIFVDRHFRKAGKVLGRYHMSFAFKSRCVDEVH